MVKLSERQQAIICQLISETPVTAQSISKLLGMSTKTIRKEIKEIANLLRDRQIDIISKTGVGYYINSENTENLKLLKEEMKVKKNLWTDSSFSSKRAHTIIRTLLVNSDYMKIEELGDMLFTSRSTITLDMKKVREELSGYGIKLKNTPHKGLSIEANEHQIRMCLVDEYSYFSQDENIIQERNYEELFSYGEAQKNFFQDTVYSALEKYPNIEIPYYHINRIILLVGLQLRRKAFSLKDSYSSKYVYQIKQTETYSLAKYILEKIKEEYQVEFDSLEIVLLAIVLEGFRDFGKTKNIESYPKFLTYYDLAEEILLNLSKLNGFTDFAYDNRLSNEIARHFLSMRVRLEYAIKIDFSLNKEIKQRVGALELAVQCSAILTDHWGLEIDTNELCFLTTVFYPVFGRYKTVNVKRNIGIISSIGNAFGIQIAERFKRNFSEYINEIQVIKASDLISKKNKDLLCIFSDVPKNQLPDVNIPIYPYKTFFDEQDKLKIRYLLTLGYESYGKVEAYFKPQLFFDNLNLTSIEETFSECYHKLNSQLNLPEEFYEDIVNRNRIMSIEIGNNVGILKAMDTHIDETFFSVFILKRPIFWKVDTIQILIIWHHDKYDKQSVTLYESGMIGRVLRTVFGNQENIIKLLTNPTYSNLLELIQNSRNY